MSKNITRIHDADGRITLTAIRPGRDKPGLEAITAMRWRDAGGNEGRDSHVRLALFVERGGEIYVEVEGEPVRVRMEEDDRFLHTPGYAEDEDPILSLPTY